MSRNNSRGTIDRLMHPARIAELLEPFLCAVPTPCHSDRSPSAARRVEEPAVPSSAQLAHISTYIDILQRWNARINLTAIRDEEQIVTRHFGESLFAARHLFPRSSSAISADSALKGFDFDPSSAEAGSRKPEARVADLGSGAGFPGIPIKLWSPEVNVTLIESNQKKATFLREVIRALTLTDINVFPGRAQQLTSANAPAKFDLVTLRAVEHFAVILPVAASLLSPGGRLALLISHTQIAEAQSVLPALAWEDPIGIPQSASRILQLARSIRSDRNQDQ